MSGERFPGGDTLPETVIEVDRLSKCFDDATAVDSISFSIHRGEIFGFLGPNGAGKTTTINMLTGLAAMDSGSVRIAGIDLGSEPNKVQRLIGVVPDESNLYPELSGYDNLCFCAALYGIPGDTRKARAEVLLNDFGLSEAAGRKFAGYSRGMKRKLTIAAGIIHEPPILFLDEPTTGIDVASSRQIRKLIADLHGRGTTVFLTTHYIEEAERLCQRIAFIVGGRIVRTDTVENLMQPVQEKRTMMISVLNPDEALAEYLDEAFPELEFQSSPGGRIRVESSEDIDIGPLVRFLEKKGSRVMEARRVGPSLEDVFVRVTGIESETMQREKTSSAGGT